MKFLVNVDCGVDVEGAHYDLGQEFEADVARAEVVALRKVGRIVPVERQRLGQEDDSAPMLKDTEK